MGLKISCLKSVSEICELGHVSLLPGNLNFTIYPWKLRGPKKVPTIILQLRAVKNLSPGDGRCFFNLREPGRFSAYVLAPNALGCSIDNPCQEGVFSPAHVLGKATSRRNALTSPSSFFCSSDLRLRKFLIAIFRLLNLVCFHKGIWNAVFIDLHGRHGLSARSWSSEVNNLGQAANCKVLKRKPKRSISPVGLWFSGPKCWHHFRSPARFCEPSYSSRHCLFLSLRAEGFGSRSPY